MSFYQWQGESLLIVLQVQPRASRDEIIGPHGEALKIRIIAPPVEGKANRYLRRQLAEWFGVRERDIELLQGEGSRHKRVMIHAPTQIPAIIAPLIPTH